LPQSVSVPGFAFGELVANDPAMKDPEVFVLTLMVRLALRKIATLKASDRSAADLTEFRKKIVSEISRLPIEDQPHMTGAEFKQRALDAVRVLMDTSLDQKTLQ
jgi:hypothetical protein